ncbi:hypothetical protein FQN54_003107 [Arachnomyces sp. PD_36]|nr:hypothetical protein FQN54_003107 [Arachnomyces sp. PD_36]
MSGTECRAPKQFYVCSTGFRGCCAHDPCASGTCRDDDESTTKTKTKTRTSTKTTSTTSTTSNTQSQTSTHTSTPTIITSTATSTAESDLLPTTTSEANPGPEDHSGSSNKGALIGGIIGGLLALLLIAILLFLFCRRRKAKKNGVSEYHNVPDKTPELDSPNPSVPYHSPGNRSSFHEPSKLSVPPVAAGQDGLGVHFPGTPSPNELPALPQTQPLELPNTVYNPPIPELSHNPTRELINQQSIQQNSLIEPGHPSRYSNPTLVTTTPEGAVLGSNLNSVVRNQTSNERIGPRHHVMSFMSFDGSDSHDGGA